MFKFDVTTGEIFIYDVIGSPDYGMIDAGAVVDALGEMDGKPVTVRLKTPGGSVFEAIAIYNALMRYSGGVVTVVDSLAASAGSYILQAGKRRIVAPNSEVMVHEAWTMAAGNAAALRKDADLLESVSGVLADGYSLRSGRSRKDVLKIMAEETWYTAADAIKAGFADQLGMEAKASAKPARAGSQNSSGTRQQIKNRIALARAEAGIPQYGIAASATSPVRAIERARRLAALSR